VKHLEGTRLTRPSPPSHSAEPVRRLDRIVRAFGKPPVPPPDVPPAVQQPRWASSIAGLVSQRGRGGPSSFEARLGRDKYVSQSRERRLLRRDVMAGVESRVTKSLDRPLSVMGTSLTASPRPLSAAPPVLPQSTSPLSPSSPISYRTQPRVRPTTPQTEPDSLSVSPDRPSFSSLLHPARRRWCDDWCSPWTYAAAHAPLCWCG